MHGFYEILDALIQHFTGHAQWIVQIGTSFLLIQGVKIDHINIIVVAGLAYPSNYRMIQN